MPKAEQPAAQQQQDDGSGSLSDFRQVYALSAQAGLRLMMVSVFLPASADSC